MMNIIPKIIKQIEERLYKELPLGYAEKAIEIIKDVVNEALRSIWYKNLI